MASCLEATYIPHEESGHEQHQFNHRHMAPVDVVNHGQAGGNCSTGKGEDKHTHLENTMDSNSDDILRLELQTPT